MNDRHGHLVRIDDLMGTGNDIKDISFILVFLKFGTLFKHIRTGAQRAAACV
jgi:hypothetical protein